LPGPVPRSTRNDAKLGVAEIEGSRQSPGFVVPSVEYLHAQIERGLLADAERSRDREVLPYRARRPRVSVVPGSIGARRACFLGINRTMSYLDSGCRGVDSKHSGRSSGITSAPSTRKGTSRGCADHQGKPNQPVSGPTDDHTFPCKPPQHGVSFLVSPTNPRHIRYSSNSH
jgi:hypothetical protein